MTPGTGRLAVVGLGPGNDHQRTPEASQRLAAATDLIGYEPYLNMVQPVLAHQTRHCFDNREEAQRARLALELAAEGRDVVVVSSGDPGIFAMATAVIEELHQATGTALGAVAVTIIAGVTAASAAAPNTAAGAVSITTSGQGNPPAESATDCRRVMILGISFER